jgi:regulator of replication initiation timing
LNTESKEDYDLQNTYNNLFEKYSELRKQNKQNVKKLSKFELERSKLLETLSESHVACNIPKSKNHVLMEKVKSLED